jgi:hypothetical protein
MGRHQQYEFADLATYNSEVARGIVHTAEWDAKMAEQQRRFYEQQYPGIDMPAIKPGDVIVVTVNR